MKAKLRHDALAALARDARYLAIERVLGLTAPVYLVGGCVRDALLGLQPSDLDLASPLLPVEMVSRLESADIRVVPTGLKHQTVTAVPVTGAPGIEITTFRSAAMIPSGGVHASTTIEEDLRYRDFTVNALAYDPRANRIIDPGGCLADLEAGVLRAVGDAAARFAEDPLRVLRMVRFVACFGFELDAGTLQAARASAHLLHQTSVERVRDELSKTVSSRSPASGLRSFADLGVLQMFLPELDRCRGFEQNEFHRADVFDHTLEVVEKTPPELVLRLAALFHDVGKPPTLTVDPNTGARHFFKHESVGKEMTERILERLRYPRDVIHDVCVLIETHMRPLEAGAGGIRRLLRDTGELFPWWRVLKEADATSCRMDPGELNARLSAFDGAVREVEAGPPVSPLRSLAVNGRDILALGVPEGPIVGRILRALHERVLDDPALNGKELLLALVPEVRTSLDSEQPS